MRIEIPMEESIGGSVKTIPIGEKGIVILQQITSDKKDQSKYCFTTYNAELKEASKKTFYSGDFFIPKQCIYDAKLNKIYTFLTISNPVYDKKNEEENNYTDQYDVVSFSIDNQEIKSISGQNQIKGDFMKMIAKNDIVYWIGFSLPIPKMRLGISKTPTGFIVSNDFNSMKTNYKVMSSEGASKMVDINFDSKNNIETYVEYIYKGGGNPNYKTMLKRFDPSLNALDSTEVPTKEAKRILSAAIKNGSSLEEIVIGSFTLEDMKRDRMVYLNYSRETADGIYFMKIKNNETPLLKYYPYFKFKNYAKVIKPKNTENYVEREEKGFLKGVQPSIQRLQVVHDIITLKNGNHVVVCEIYQPEYERHSKRTYDIQTKSYVTEYEDYFIGYRYQTALVSCFDNEGEMLWDQVFTMGNIVTDAKKEQVQVMVTKDETIVLLYNDGFTINAMTIKDGKVLSDTRDASQMQTDKSGDVVGREWNCASDYWYDNYFVAYGVQRIKNKEDLSGDKKRTVFYFNKIKYENNF